MTFVIARRLIAASLLATTAAIAAPASAEKIDNSYICVFRPGTVERGNVQAEANRAAQAAGGGVTHVYTTAIRGFSAHVSAQGVGKMMSHNPNIAYCEQDQTVHAVQGRPGGGGGGTGQQVPWGIARVHGGVAPPAGARAWIIDSGIDGSHPDLNVNAGLSRNFSNGSSWNDGNGHERAAERHERAVEREVPAARPGLSDDENAEEAEQHGRPAPHADLFLEQHDREQHRPDRHREVDRRRLGQRQQDHRAEIEHHASERPAKAQQAQVAARWHAEIALELPLELAM